MGLNHRATIVSDALSLDDSGDVEAHLIHCDHGEVPQRRTIHLKNESAKWRVVSSLQKAIRRGNATNAVAMASALMNSEQAEYLYRRMCVIALEDIAFADLPLCGEVFAFAASKANRKAMGGDDIALALVKRLAEGVKDRTPCELSVTTGYSPTSLSTKKDLAARPAQQVLDFAINSPDPRHRQMCGRLLAGTLTIDDKPVTEHKNKAAYLSTFDGVPALLQYFGRRSYAMGGELVGLATSTRVVWEWLYSAAGSRGHQDIETSDLVDYSADPIVKGLLLPALDMHTYEGKTAFTRLLKKCPDFKERYVELGGNPLGALKNAVFMVEGKLCNQRLTSPWIEKMKHSSHVAQVEASGLTPEHLSMLCADVDGMLPVLNELRTAVLTG